MVGISQGYTGIYFSLYLAPLLIAHTAVNPSPNYGDFILFTNNPHVSFMCLELSFLSLSPENLFYLGSFFVQCLEEFWVFHWAGNWTTVKGEDFFPIGQKSVKQWLRYSNWSFKDYNQVFGEKRTVTSMMALNCSEALLLHLQVGLLPTERHTVIWEEK